MKRPEINGWEVTTNENGIKMATLPRDTMEEILKYVEYADKQLRIHGVVGRSEQLVCDECGYPMFYHKPDDIMYCHGCNNTKSAN